MSKGLIGLAVASMLCGAATQGAAASPCRLDLFKTRAQTNGWIVQELTYEERLNFLNHLNRDDGVRANFYPPHVWETVRKKNELIHIRVVYLDANDCVIGNSGEIGFNEFSYLLAPNEGF